MLKFLNKVIIPLVEFLHNWGIFELCAYFISFEFIVESKRMFPEVGFYLAFSGLMFVLPSFAYSTTMHAKKLRIIPNEKRLT